MISKSDNSVPNSRCWLYCRLEKQPLVYFRGNQQQGDLSYIGINHEQDFLVSRRYSIAIITFDYSAHVCRDMENIYEPCNNVR